MDFRASGVRSLKLNIFLILKEVKTNLILRSASQKRVRFSFTIRLMVVGACCHVLEPIFFGKGFEFTTRVHRTTVRHNFIGDPISSHVSL